MLLLEFWLRFHVCVAPWSSEPILSLPFCVHTWCASNLRQRMQYKTIRHRLRSCCAGTTKTWPRYHEVDTYHTHTHTHTQFICQQQFIQWSDNNSMKSKWSGRLPVRPRPIYAGWPPKVRRTSRQSVMISMHVMSTSAWFAGKHYITRCSLSLESRNLYYKQSLR